MQKIFLPALILLSLLISACATSTPQPTPEVVSVYSSSFTQPWLTDVYACAAESSAVVRLSDSVSDAQIVLQIGEPEFLSGFAYQIDEEDIIVIMNNARPPVVDIQQINGLFTGQLTNLNQITPEWGEVHAEENGDINVWVFPSNSDVQRIFDKLVLKGRPVVSTAMVAVTPHEMLEAIKNDTSSIGILTQSWNPENKVFEQAIIATVPVLALTQAEPQGVVKNLLACLQK